MDNVSNVYYSPKEKVHIQIRNSIAIHVFLGTELQRLMNPGQKKKKERKCKKCGKPMKGHKRGVCNE